MQGISKIITSVFISLLLLMTTSSIFATSVYKTKAGCMMCHQMGSITPVETVKKPENRSITKKKMI